MRDDNTAPPGPPQSVPLPDALERLLPHCNGDPFEVAEWLNRHHRTGKIPLLDDDGVEMAPAANPGMLGIVARITPSGKHCLEVQVRPGGWDPRWTRGHPAFSFERESFEAHLASAFKNRGGRPRAYKREDILIEGAMVAFEDGVPGTFEAFWGAVEARLGDASPGETLLKEILGPLYKRLERSTHRR
jgi:hypothetical protein